MSWYRSDTIGFMFEPIYLVDPGQQASSANAQQNRPQTYTHMPNQQNYQFTNT